MSFIRRVLPHICICFSTALAVVCYLNVRNPSMGFLLSKPGVILTMCAVVSAFVCGVLLAADARRAGKNHTENKKRHELSS